MPGPGDTLNALRATGAVAVLRASSSRGFLAVADTLVAHGLLCVELTLTSPGAVEALAAVSERIGGAVVGAGSVVEPAQVAEVVDAGAQYVVAPGFDAEVVERARERGVAAIPGALTPTEIAEARRAGASAVKVFPVSAIGGVDYIRALRAPLPDVDLVPSGGISLAAAGDYLRAGCLAIGVGAPLLGDAAAGGSLDELAERARLLVRVIETARADG